MIKNYWKLSVAIFVGVALLFYGAMSIKHANGEKELLDELKKLTAQDIKDFKTILPNDLSGESIGLLNGKEELTFIFSALKQIELNHPYPIMSIRILTDDLKLQDIRISLATIENVEKAYISAKMRTSQGRITAGTFSTLTLDEWAKKYMTRGNIVQK